MEDLTRCAVLLEARVTGLEQTDRMFSCLREILLLSTLSKSMRGA